MPAVRTLQVSGVTTPAAIRRGNGQAYQGGHLNLPAVLGYGQSSTVQEQVVSG
jgi:hypothetical protein